VRFAKSDLVPFEGLGALDDADAKRVMWLRLRAGVGYRPAVEWTKTDRWVPRGRPSAGSPP
jgi:hypothetical protein